jgi:glycosyltransferase involved in cell wall biosynthesis
MACGTPVVSTPVGVMGELIEDGRNGALCGFDVGSLAAALERVLSDDAAARALGEAGRRSVQGFERRTTIRGYAEGLKSVVARVGGGA